MKTLVVFLFLSSFVFAQPISLGEDVPTDQATTSSAKYNYISKAGPSGFSGYIDSVVVGFQTVSGDSAIIFTADSTGPLTYKIVDLAKIYVYTGTIAEYSANFPVGSDQYIKRLKVNPFSFLGFHNIAGKKIEYSNDGNYSGVDYLYNVDPIAGENMTMTATNATNNVYLLGFGQAQSLKEFKTFNGFKGF